MLQRRRRRGKKIYYVAERSSAFCFFVRLQSPKGLFEPPTHANVTDSAIPWFSWTAEGHNLFVYWKIFAEPTFVSPWRTKRGGGGNHIVFPYTFPFLLNFDICWCSASGQICRKSKGNHMCEHFGESPKFSCSDRIQKKVLAPWQADLFASWLIGYIYFLLFCFYGGSLYIEATESLP